MDQLITDVLTFARVGTEAIEPEVVEMSQLLKECWADHSQTDATLCVKTDQKIQADRKHLRQLLTNLLSNAVKHGGSNVSVTVGTIADGFSTSKTMAPGSIPMNEKPCLKPGTLPVPKEPALV